MAETGQRRQQLESELAQSMTLTAQLQAQLRKNFQAKKRYADELAERAAKPERVLGSRKPSNGFIDPDQGMAEILEAPAGTDPHPAPHTNQIVELQQTLAPSEQQRRAPAHLPGRYQPPIWK